MELNNKPELGGDPVRTFESVVEIDGHDAPRYTTRDRCNSYARGARK